MGELAKKQDTTLALEQIERAAEYVVKSKLFGVQTKDQAVALMLLAQAEGIHPMRAVQEYHIINGRPAMRADAMLARFLQAGGKVTWHELSETKASATFEHPSGGKATITWTIDDAKRAGLVKPNSGWVKFPRAMLRSRVVSEGVRTVYPGVATGIYTPEEVVDFEPINEEPRRVEAKVIEVEEAQTETKVPARALVTPAQVTKIAATLNELGLVNGRYRDVKLRLAAMIVGREVDSSKELTKEEASRFIDYLEKLREGLQAAGVKDATEAANYITRMVESGAVPPTDVEALKADLEAFRTVGGDGREELFEDA